MTLFLRDPATGSEEPVANERTSRTAFVSPDAAEDGSQDHGESTAIPATSTKSIARYLAAASRRRKGGRGGKGGSGDSRPSGLLTDEELREIEETYAEGITAVQVVDIFSTRKVRFSEATFRKYVQQGLLPRSRRVGRKGKHRGSLGVYPAKTVRRVNAIKRLMGEGYTIEEIQEQFLRFTDVIESLEEGLSEVFTRLDRELESPRFDKKGKRGFKRDIAEARKVADELMARLDDLARRATTPPDDRYRSTGAAGSAEDLL